VLVAALQMQMTLTAAKMMAVMTLYYAEWEVGQYYQPGDSENYMKRHQDKFDDCKDLREEVKLLSELCI